MYRAEGDHSRAFLVLIVDPDGDHEKLEWYNYKPK
jgi:hypothetical protein